MKTRRLGDLYVKGESLTIDDGLGDPITVWIQKPNPVQHEAIIRSANSARAQVLLELKNKEGDIYLSALDEIDTQYPTLDTLITFLVETDMSEKKQKIEAELLFDKESEWAEDNYLQGLYDLWNDKMKDRYFSDEEDEEATKIFQELKRFSEEVEKSLDGYRKKARSDYELMGEDRVLDRVIEKHIKSIGTQAWFAAYRRSQILFATREIDDHSKFYFEDIEEVRSLAIEVIQPLVAKIEEISVDPMEGKD